jgi:hypothetical protein
MHNHSKIAFPLDLASSLVPKDERRCTKAPTILRGGIGRGTKDRSIIIGTTNTRKRASGKRSKIEIKILVRTGTRWVMAGAGKKLLMPQFSPLMRRRRRRRRRRTSLSATTKKIRAETIAEKGKPPF